MAEKKVTGPASYFPSIEKKYGKPIEHWMKELKKVSKLAHMEQVAHLKESLKWDMVMPTPSWQFFARKMAYRATALLYLPI